MPLCPNQVKGYVLYLYNTVRVLQVESIPPWILSDPPPPWEAGGGGAGADTVVFFGCSETPPTAVCNIFFIFNPTDVNFPLPFKFHCRIQST